VIGGDSLLLVEVCHFIVTGGVGQSDGRDIVAIVKRRIGKVDLLRRVEIEILLRRHPGQMRLVKSGAEEERLVFVLLHELRDTAGGVAVGLVFILVVGGQPRELDAILQVLSDGPLLLLGGFVLFVSRVFDGILLDAGVFRNVPGDGVLKAAVGDLADAGGEVAMVSEMLRKEYYVSKVSARRGVVIEDAGDVRAAAAEQRRARWIAQGILAIGAVEANTARGQAIDVGCVHDGVAITTDAIVEIVGGDEQDI
jgi:hypothetical protein